jgi:hypothetical protein
LRGALGSNALEAWPRPRALTGELLGVLTEEDFDKAPGESSPKELDLPAARHGWTGKEMKLARQLIDTLSDEWDPKAFKDAYTDVLRELIEAKVEGKEIVAPDMPKRERVPREHRNLQSLRSVDHATGHGVGSDAAPTDQGCVVCPEVLPGDEVVARRTFGVWLRSPPQMNQMTRIS